MADSEASPIVSLCLEWVRFSCFVNQLSCTESPSSDGNVILASFEYGVAAETTNETALVQRSLGRAAQRKVQVRHFECIRDLVPDPEVRHSHSVLS